MQSTINQRFIFVRKSLGLTQTEVAKELGLTPQAVSALEKKGNPSQGTITAFCKAFSVNEMWLMDGVGEAFAKEVQPAYKVNQPIDWKQEAYEMMKKENEWLKRMLELALGDKQQLSKYKGLRLAVSPVLLPKGAYSATSKVV